MVREITGEQVRVHLFIEVTGQLEELLVSRMHIGVRLLFEGVRL
jgi:hypothetical protein